ncbi:MAG TPA: thioredoxin domain-containing protein [Candidatus Dormibacteraeota bacterium]|jgi:hypothetical protein|nr:thioredoxin domain-containing protein [Candidatus Dormibacteraeota bacterium]
MNRLASETSPYLLQHAANPVDWYAWGEEALARARAEDRPILLSIGYSACHWCHVMERESFEDQQTAAEMNRDFVCVKVDREERPDLDAIYMAAVQQLTGSGGWPMTVFLTPDLKPFYGGTYFPPQPRYGMPSFRQVLAAVRSAYGERRGEVEESAERLARQISAEVGAGPGGPLAPGILDAAAARLMDRFDPVHGGFGGAPKFPQAMALDFLLRAWRRSGDERMLEAVGRSLTEMGHGGIYDHLGGGFARYSTDEEWLVPHFEKMLYDQALLAQVYLHHFQAAGAPGSRSACEGIVDYVLRDLASPGGGFCSSEDADSEGVEGRFYTWTYAEAEAAGGADFEVLRRAYDITPEGNWEGRNILRLLPVVRSLPDQLGIGREELQERLARGRRAMREARAARVRPARDDKVVTAWNGLMLAALAEAAAVLGRADYLAAAQRCGAFLLEEMWQEGRLRRTWRDGAARIDAYLEDYAALADGLLRLYQADFDPRWFNAARELGDAILARFADPAGGVFYATSPDHERVLFRPRDFDDNAVPAGNSLAVEVLVELGLLTGEDRYRAAATSALEALAPAMGSHPLFFGRLLGALDLHLGPALEVALVGDLASATAAEMLRRLRGGFLPNVVVAAGPPGGAEPALLRDRPVPLSAEVAAYVCSGFVCRAPVTDAEALVGQLEAMPAEGGWRAL